MKQKRGKEYNYIYKIQRNADWKVDSPGINLWMEIDRRVELAQDSKTPGNLSENIRKKMAGRRVQ